MALTTDISTGTVQAEWLNLLDLRKLKLLLTKVEMQYSEVERKDSDLGEALELLKEYLNERN